MPCAYSLFIRACTQQGDDREFGIFQLHQSTRVDVDYIRQTTMRSDPLHHTHTHTHHFPCVAFWSTAAMCSVLAVRCRRSPAQSLKAIDPLTCVESSFGSLQITFLRWHLFNRTRHSFSHRHKESSCNTRNGVCSTLGPLWGS